MIVAAVSYDVLVFMMDVIRVFVYILNAKNLAPPFLSIFSGSKSMTTKINVL